jgi:hypothetical protein
MRSVLCICKYSSCFGKPLLNSHLMTPGVRSHIWWDYSALSCCSIRKDRIHPEESTEGRNQVNPKVGYRESDLGLLGAPGNQHFLSIKTFQVRWREYDIRSHSLFMKELNPLTEFNTEEGGGSKGKPVNWFPGRGHTCYYERPVIKL